MAVAILLALAPRPSGAASIARIYCSGLTMYVDANAFAYLQRATLNRDRFSGFVWFGLDPTPMLPWTRETLQDARRNLVLGFQLDDGVITGIHPPITSYSTTITLKFSHLKAGKHRLRIGFMGAGNTLDLDNAYCFSSPGYFTLKSLKQFGK